MTSLLEPGDTVQCSAEVKNGLSLSFIYAGIISFDFDTATLKLELKSESGLLCSSRKFFFQKKKNPNPVNILVKMYAVTYSLLKCEISLNLQVSLFFLYFLLRSGC